MVNGRPVPYGYRYSVYARFVFRYLYAFVRVAIFVIAGWYCLNDREPVLPRRADVRGGVNDSSTCVGVWRRWCIRQPAERKRKRKA